MVSIGYFLSCEESGPRELVRQAQLAEQAGFDQLWISDHYHPWTAENVPCGPDLDKQIAAVKEFVDAGADEVFVQQIGPEQHAFFQSWEQEGLPALR